MWSLRFQYYSVHFDLWERLGPSFQESKYLQRAEAFEMVKSFLYFSQPKVKWRIHIPFIPSKEGACQGFHTEHNCWNHREIPTDLDLTIQKLSPRILPLDFTSSPVLFPRSSLLWIRWKFRALCDHIFHTYLSK